MRNWTIVVAALVGLGIAQTASAQSGELGTETLDAAMLDRALTLPAGQVEVNAYLSHLRLSVGEFSANATVMGAGPAYGVTNELEVGVGTVFTIDPDAGWGDVLLPSIAYGAHNTDQLDIAVSVNAPLSFAEGADLLSTVVIGATSRFALNSTMALFFGHGLLNIGTADPSFIDLNLNLAFSIQPMPNASVRFDTQLASIAASGDFNETSHLGDAIPLSITGLFAAMPMLDVFAQLNFPSLEDAADLMVISAGVLVRP